jgi:hypothetical protein
MNKKSHLSRLTLSFLKKIKKLRIFGAIEGRSMREIMVEWVS